MSANLTADQAAQRLLSTIDTLSAPKPLARGKSGQNNKRAKLDSSSISWAFHDSVDSTGLLRWLATNIDAEQNGLTSDELELLAHMQRTNYSPDTATPPNDSGDFGVAGSLLPAFELRREKARSEAKVARLQSYLDTIRSQSGLLGQRADLVSVELAELLEEEERLKRSAKMSDAEVSRLTTAYTGMLDEASLAAKSLMARLQAEPSTASYFYQSAEAIDRLGDSTSQHLNRLNERLAEQLATADKLPSPWSEFKPFSTQTVSELLQLAQDEHKRLGETAAGLVKTRLAISVEHELVRAVEEEISRMRGETHDSVIKRCRELAHNQAIDDFSGYLALQVNDHTARLVAETAEKMTGAQVLPETHASLSQLNSCCKQLAQIQSERLDRVLGAALCDLKPQELALTAIAHALTAERGLLDEWIQLWAKVASSLHEDNAALKEQEAILRKHAAASTSSSVIAPDDLLALSLKRMLNIHSQSCRTLLTEPESNAESSEPVDSTDEDLRARLVAGAFTSWDALLAEAKAHTELESSVQDAVLARAKMAAGVERQM
ncbi:hypothetical protein IWW51_003350 [Coemansia sp. RSA 2702]|nr:hypothetical protein IWW51_003350 [Coemansia sp. RSA 2702]